MIQVTLSGALKAAAGGNAVFEVEAAPIRAHHAELLATGAPHLPPGEHVYLSCRSPLSSEGFAVEDATMWGPDGRVLAVARQTRLAGA